MEEKQLEVESLGYSISCGLNNNLEHKVYFGVRLQPLSGSPNPIEDDLFAKIKNEILTDNYKGVHLEIVYIGMVKKR